MTTADYETVLREAQRLEPSERRRLITELEAGLSAVPLFPLLPPDPALGDQERAEVQDFLARLDTLVAEVGAAWKDRNVSAVDAVREQRREL